MPSRAPAIGCGRVARAHADRDRAALVPEPRAAWRDADERRAQVALDVDASALSGEM